MDSIDVKFLDEAEWEADEVSFCCGCVCVCVEVTDSEE